MCRKSRGLFRNPHPGSQQRSFDSTANSFETKPNEIRTPLCAKLNKKTQVRTVERLVVEKSELQLLCLSYQPPFETKAKPRNRRSFSTSTAGHQEKPKRQDPSEARDRF
ncbi:hypothetical protein V6N13_036357 [Hibiscus sabdariffa]|uniref:Uncharacterized protein n=1 Tax=Hibiscus sabdariffa TaxID=183260 RepID=A0ABR2S6M1_9ROSI